MNEPSVTDVPTSCEYSTIGFSTMSGPRLYTRLQKSVFRYTGWRARPS